MNRRAFIGSLEGGLLAAPLVAEGQSAGKVYRIGYLLEGRLARHPLKGGPSKRLSASSRTPSSER
jgi:hypothetical protein